MTEPSLDLGIAGIEPTPELAARPGAWAEVARSLAGRPFLHSEGLSTEVGPPQRLSGPLLAECREMVERFDGFYRGAIDAFHRDPACRGDFLVNPLFDAAIAADAQPGPRLPLSRLDCVLGEDGRLRTIEINAVGVCTIHLRAAAYLSRALLRHGLAGDAEVVDRMQEAMVASVGRFHDALRGAKRERTIGVIYLANMHRGSRRTWRHAFSARGWRYLEGQVGDVEIAADGLRMRGVPLDVLWGDYVFYLGYQFVRYRETRWASKHGDYRRAEEETARLLADRRVLALLSARAAVNVSPASAYLALPKSLLSWIHRADRPVDEQARPWLAAHVARTYAAFEREGGVLTVEEAVRRREELLLKPCQYGGSHGILCGRDTAPAEWRARLEATWRDPGWALQDFYEPRRGAGGRVLILGLYNYGGVLGGVTVQAAPTRIVSVRQSTFLPVVVPEER